MADDEMMSIETPRPDDAAMIVAQLVCLCYLREDGSRGYAVHCKGEEPMTSYLGLTVVAQEHIREWGGQDG